MDNTPELATLLRIPDLAMPAMGTQQGSSAAEPMLAAPTDDGVILAPSRLGPQQPWQAKVQQSIKALASSMGGHQPWLPRKWTHHLSTVGTIAVAIIACTLIARAMRREKLSDTMLPDVVAAEDLGSPTETALAAAPQAAYPAQDPSLLSGGLGAPPTPMSIERQPVPPAREPERLPQVEPAVIAYPPPNNVQTVDLRDGNGLGRVVPTTPQRPTPEILPTRWDGTYPDSNRTYPDSNPMHVVQGGSRWGVNEHGVPSRHLPEASTSTPYPATNPLVYQTLEEIRIAIQPEQDRGQVFDSTSNNQIYR